MAFAVDGRERGQLPSVQSWQNRPLLFDCARGINTPKVRACDPVKYVNIYVAAVWGSVGPSQSSGLHFGFSHSAETKRSIPMPP